MLSAVKHNYVFLFELRDSPCESRKSCDQLLGAAVRMTNNAMTLMKAPETQSEKGMIRAPTTLTKT
jgi:hypothetical protein